MVSPRNCIRLITCAFLRSPQQSERYPCTKVEFWTQEHDGGTSVFAASYTKAYTRPECRVNADPRLGSMTEFDDPDYVKKAI